MVQDLLGSKLKASFCQALQMTKSSQIKTQLPQKGQIYGGPEGPFAKML